MRREKGIELFYRRALPIVLAVLMANFGVPGGGFAVAEDSRVRRSTTEKIVYDGETLFRGIFFGVGPVAKLFPEIWESEQMAPHAKILRESPEALALEERLIALLREESAPGPGGPAREELEAFAASPGRGDFFERFAADLQSGDHLRIEKALGDAAVRLTQAAVKETGVDPARPPLDGTCVVILIVHTLAIVLNVAVTVAVALAIALYIATSVYVVANVPWFQDASVSSLQREVWIDAFARRLAGPEAR